MSEENKTRFRSAEEALRFYFRLRELLYSGRTRRLVADELLADACTIAANALDDCQCIGWSMRGLDDLALWLLGEIYGPTCFGVHRRTFSHACKAGGLEFPDREFRLREVGMIHERALGTGAAQAGHDPRPPSEDRARRPPVEDRAQAGAPSRQPGGESRMRRARPVR